MRRINNKNIFLVLMIYFFTTCSVYSEGLATVDMHKIDGGYRIISSTKDHTAWKIEDKTFYQDFNSKLFNSNNYKKIIIERLNDSDIYNIFVQIYDEQKGAEKLLNYYYDISGRSSDYEYQLIDFDITNICGSPTAVVLLRSRLKATNSLYNYDRIFLEIKKSGRSVVYLEHQSKKDKNGPEYYVTWLDKVKHQCKAGFIYLR